MGAWITSISLAGLGDRARREINRGTQHADQPAKNGSGRCDRASPSHKVRDGFAAGLQDAQGAEVGSYEGYVPDFFPGEHYGDYLILNIDLETGQITNWKKPAAADIEKMLSQGEED